MNVLDEFRWQARTSYEWLESIVADVTPEQARWRPPGRANTIATTYAHIVRNIDEDLNHWMFRRPMLNEGPWRGQTGLVSGRPEWEQNAIDWPALREYGRAMCAFAVETVDALTEDDLAIVTDLSTADIEVWHGIDIVRLTVGHHVRMHGGEIACLKGLEGLKGYRSGLDTSRP
ncbi:MAG: DinB family protein [Dehalococcoidia bacterium]|nr:MAG: DinB family protein [Dehalococcoidia bacterium]